MVEIKFREPMVHGVIGRNGYAHFGGISIHPTGKTVSLTPTGPSGNPINAGMYLFADECGEVARAIAESAAEADPGSREKIAAQLRAALVTIESRADEPLDDDISSFSAMRR